MARTRLSAIRLMIFLLLPVAYLQWLPILCCVCPLHAVDKIPIKKIVYESSECATQYSHL